MEKTQRFNEGFVPEDMPCKQDCPNRSASCRVKASADYCNKYDEWQQKKLDRIDTYHITNSKNRRSLMKLSGGRRL
jgi:ABC-type dipeptide/oligopeptide/nickel transport system ATPase subunit